MALEPPVISYPSSDSESESESKTKTNRKVLTKCRDRNLSKESNSKAGVVTLEVSNPSEKHEANNRKKFPLHRVNAKSDFWSLLRSNRPANDEAKNKEENKKKSMKDITDMIIQEERVAKFFKNIDKLKRNNDNHEET